ncbi:hypothetical protein E0H22_14700 [Rhodopseudomonas boonkerdii]|uniref:hypothetical protein n=1 Tax=Rhodopseudomonas boonkerdii TaxID=475937 RepID=UPI001E29FAE6|nr:hypothetical protein [Rhodopseudomonas boonkerdii]UGV26821.1 hypothetical protein E0H22_14700 [Rhodopseudomonas boonkerdii]
MQADQPSLVRRGIEKQTFDADDCARKNSPILVYSMARISGAGSVAAAPGARSLIMSGAKVAPGSMEQPVKSIPAMHSAIPLIFQVYQRHWRGTIAILARERCDEKMSGKAKARLIAA